MSAAAEQLMAMDRLLMLELAAGGCAVEAQLNGMPVAALGAAGGSASLAVHEYTLAGRNQLTLVIAPPPPGATRAEPAARRDRPDLGAGAAGARRPGPVAGRSRGTRARRRRVGGRRGQAVRRAIDASARGRSAGQLPALALARRAADRASTPAVQRQVLEFLQQLGVELGRGNPEPLIAAAKLRFDELALAYQTDAERRGAALPRAPSAAVCCQGIEGRCRRWLPSSCCVRSWRVA